MAQTEVPEAASTERELDGPQAHILFSSADPPLWLLVLVGQSDSYHLQEVCLSQGNQKGKGSWLVNHF